MNKFLQSFKQNKKGYIIYFSLLLITFILLVVNFAGLTFVSAKFDNLRPFHRKAPVFYRGFEIGRVVRVKPSKDYRSTIVTMVLYPRDLRLPINTSVILKKEKKDRTEYDYVELIYPHSPSLTMVKNGSMLKGDTTVDVKMYLASQSPQTLDKIRDDISQTFGNLNSTILALGDLFVLLQEVVKENEPNLLEASKNLAEISANLKQTTVNLNNSLNQQRLNSTFSNIDLSTSNAAQTTANLHVITTSIDAAAKDINKSMPEIRSAIRNINGITANVNQITCGIAGTLKKSFGGMRVLFGKSIDQCECPILREQPR